MTYVYGATLLGTAEFVEDYAAENFTKQFPDMAALQFSMYAARKLFLGISNTVPSAEAAMHWLKNQVRAIPKGTRVTWTTPIGFVVQRDYLVTKVRRIEIKSCGLNMVTMLEPTNENHAVRTQNAIAPNYVHSLDATHLALTALRMFAADKHFVGIHDSFGTHPCDVAFMHQQLREAFIGMYSNPHLMTDFLWEIKGLGSQPNRGTLDLNRVRDSEFFFC